MNIRSDANDPKLLWQAQKGGCPAISIQEIRNKARRYHSKIRREGIIAAALGVGALAFCLFLVAISHPARIIAAASAMVISAGLSREIVISYKTHRKIWPWLPRTPLADRIPAACIDFYRRGLERQRQGMAIRHLDLLIITGVMTVSFFRLRGLIPIYFYVLIGTCMGLMFFVRERQARNLQSEIGALRSFDNHNE